MIFVTVSVELNARLECNISAISCRPVLVVEEAGVPWENHRPWANNWQTLSLAAANRVHLLFLVIYKAEGEPTPFWWYELLGNPAI